MLRYPNNEAWDNMSSVRCSQYHVTQRTTDESIFYLRYAGAKKVIWFNELFGGQNVNEVLQKKKWLMVLHAQKKD